VKNEEWNNIEAKEREKEGKFAHTCGAGLRREGGE
jgi:hypothetical protein